jgi:hypothetical protein
LAPPRLKRSARAGTHSGQAHPHLAGGTTAGFTPSISHVHTGAVRAPTPTRCNLPKTRSGRVKK